MKVRVTKCYLVQVLDDEGNEIECVYDFSSSYKEAKEAGERMLEDLKERERYDDR